MEVSRYEYWLGKDLGVTLQKGMYPSSDGYRLENDGGYSWGALVPLQGISHFYTLYNVRVVMYDFTNRGKIYYYGPGQRIDMPSWALRMGISYGADNAWLSERVVKEGMTTRTITVDSFFGMRRAAPYCKNLTKKYMKESGQAFLRETLSGTLSLHGDDFRFVWDSGLDSSFLFIINKRTAVKKGDYEYREYYRGVFAKTDCTFDYGKNKCTPKISTFDAYKDLLDGWEEEYDLIKLGTPKSSIHGIAIRPVIQVWVSGSSTVCNYLGGLYWHTETGVDGSDINLFNDGNPGDTNKDIIKKYRFAFNKTITDKNGVKNHIYARIVSAAQNMPSITSGGLSSTNGIALDSEDEFVQPGHNYKYVIGAVLGDSSFYSSTAVQREETPYGITDKEDGSENLFFSDIGMAGGKRWYPLCRDRWGDTSLWVSIAGIINPTTLADVEPNYRKVYTLNSVFAIGDVIRVLLKKINPSLTHRATRDYSSFFYGPENPVDRLIPTVTPCITQRTNVLKGDYDQAAQKCPVTLKGILEMLRDVFKCYWFIDNENQFRIEHISYFMNGGSYTVNSLAQLDFTKLEDRFNKQMTAYFQTELSFDRDGSEIPKEYILNWGEESSYVFDDVHIEMKAKNVDKTKKDELTVSDFCADIDRMLFQPEDFSEEGLALLCPARIKGNDISGWDYGVPVWKAGMTINVADGLGSNGITANNMEEYRPKEESGYYKWNKKDAFLKLEDTVTGTLDLVDPLFPYGDELTCDNGNRNTIKLYIVGPGDLITFHVAEKDNCSNKPPTSAVAAFFSMPKTSSTELNSSMFKNNCTGAGLIDATKNYIFKVPNLIRDTDMCILAINAPALYIANFGYMKTRTIEMDIVKSGYFAPTTKMLYYNEVPSTGSELKDEYGKAFTPTVQNWYASLIHSALNFYRYDLPAANYAINKAMQSIFGTPQGYVKRIASQTLRFPSEEDPAPDGTIRTELGTGYIDGMSVDIDSRTVSAEVVYDPTKLNNV